MAERVCQRPGCERLISSRRRRDTRWCSRSCESKARRQDARRAAFEAANPGSAELLRAEGQSLAELHQRARPPVHWADQIEPDLIEFSGYQDQDDHQDQDDEAGIYAGESDPWSQRLQNAADRAKAVDAIRAEYDQRAAPLIAVQKRNPGPMRPELAALVRERDRKVNALTRDHQIAEAHRLAARDRPYRQASAQERQVEQAAARSFAVDLGRGRFLRDDHADVGRVVHDAWLWR